MFVKKVFWGAGITIFVIFVLFIQIRFSSQNPTDKEDGQGDEDFRVIRQAFQDLFTQAKQDYDLLKKEARNVLQSYEGSDEVSEKFQFQLFGLSEVLHSDKWTSRISTSTQGIADNVAGVLQIEGRQECQWCFEDQVVCDDGTTLNTLKNYEFYPISMREALIEKTLNNHDHNAQCKQEIFAVSDDYVVVDTCSNQPRCNDFNIIFNNLREYFSTYKNE